MQQFAIDVTLGHFSFAGTRLVGIHASLFLAYASMCGLRLGLLLLVAHVGSCTLLDYLLDNGCQYLARVHNVTHFLGHLSRQPRADLLHEQFLLHSIACWLDILKHLGNEAGNVSLEELGRCHTLLHLHIQLLGDGILASATFLLSLQAQLFGLQAA